MMIGPPVLAQPHPSSTATCRWPIRAKPPQPSDRTPDAGPIAQPGRAKACSNAVVDFSDVHSKKQFLKCGVRLS
jgi:hypothetical protein